MLSYVYHTDKTLELKDVPKPMLNGEGALIKTIACSICGTDVRTHRFGSTKIDEGRIIGHEVVGEIIELSESVKDFEIGEHVAVAPAIGCGICYSCKNGKTNMCEDLKTIGFQYDGGFADYMVIPLQAFKMGNVYKLPEVKDDSVFTLSEPLACAINAQSYLNIKQGEDVVIFGSGIIGCMHAELALYSGAKNVIIIETSFERIKQASKLLKDVIFINSAETDIFAEVSRLTDGKGADVAIIACSVGSAQADGMKILAKCGRISLFGGLSGNSTGFIDSNLIHYREISVFGVHASTPEQNKQAMEMIHSGKINVEKYITERYPLKDIEKAFKDIEDGRVMKAVIVNK
ncbi:zinc-dependent dehydrogenase [Ruminiclostridium cellulolyticum]|uniref:Alcohol dehydrogenase GroES domain protein n=1 Tax=Ruminiclostridium cellulolyticum (strain ATCC 35319 / DSM 5812 / JCM 6584 / H10) TaxID=394503 RepID=B8I9D2_RUMCH|nr:zinc-dependent dehydrogenase [Ruminiclostridium cellulolyticum]ACL75392.1 Alcohol dehydrogenase GroES domain protein [Ruminiclostridium cellulolyticum H10]